MCISTDTTTSYVGQIPIWAYLPGICRTPFCKYMYYQFFHNRHGPQCFNNIGRLKVLMYQYN